LVFCELRFLNFQNLVPHAGLPFYVEINAKSWPKFSNKAVSKSLACGSLQEKWRATRHKRFHPQKFH